ncbi:orotate phosphoribosyltransferase [Perkinsus olseni]|uniref:orotate phosphoribosyltransferase n=1 Tax=Perkinsus olseni TaxID=32597 RepID=A0A7J6LXH4_PEROL|nr:orotate phosphoribosyltransferase [Perkinsus olseni]
MPASPLAPYQSDFIALAVGAGCLKFGEFTLKSGRVSPYFFNAGGFSTGGQLLKLAEAYADAIVAEGIEFDVIFGPAYKGIPLCAAVAMVFALKHGRPGLPYAFNRKEVKDHGEGGMIIGGPLKGRVLLIDDVITAGTAIQESVHLLSQFPECELVGAIVAVDRQERASPESTKSAVQLASEKFGIKIYSIVQLNSILTYARQEGNSGEVIPPGMDEALEKYRQQYGRLFKSDWMTGGITYFLAFTFPEVQVQMADSISSRAVAAAKSTAAVRGSIDERENEAVKYWSERKERIEKEISDLQHQAAEYRKTLEDIERKISGGLGQRVLEAPREEVDDFTGDIDLAKPAISRDRLAAQLRLLEVFGSSEATLDQTGVCKLRLVPRHQAQIESTQSWTIDDFELKASVEDNWKKLAAMLGLDIVKSHPMVKQLVGPEVKRWRMLGIGTVDHEIGWGTCTLRLKGDYGACDVHLAGTPIGRMKREGDTEDDDDDLQDMIDEFDIRGSGFSYYWENPWEIKFAVINAFWRSVRATKACGVYLKNAITKTKEELADMAAEEAEPPQPWGCDIVLVHPTNLREKLCSVAGDPMGHPYFEVFLGRTRKAKDEYSYKRVKVVVGTAFTLMTLGAIRRIMQTRRFWRSFGFARAFAMTHPVTRAHFPDMSKVSIRHRSGIFRSTYIDGVISLGDGTTQHDVHLSGIRPNADAPWRITSARLVPDKASETETLNRTGRGVRMDTNYVPPGFAKS